jgi:hypothetical protein
MYKYTAEEFETKYEEEIAYISRSEWESWIHHPCGKALRYRLMADQVGHFEDWVNDALDSDLSKWLIRRNEELLTVIYREGLYTNDAREEDN